MFVKKGPTVWVGLPDLRNNSHDLIRWGKLPVPMYQAGICMNITHQTIQNHVKKARLISIHRFGKPHIRLEDLPQTARCAFIEHIFREDVSMDNILHKADDLSIGLEMDRQVISNLGRKGVLIREYMPGNIPRYPHWGLEDNSKEIMQNYVMENNPKHENL